MAILTVKRIINGKWSENCYIIQNKKSDALVIDPGSQAERIIEYIKDNNLNVLAILNTHAHYDHIGAVSVIQKEYSSPFYLHSKDHRLLKRANFYRLMFDGDSPINIPDVNKFIDEAENPLSIGEFFIHFLSTPGHTHGSVCFIADNLLFTGDTLFKRNIGRVDLPGGNKNDLYKSLRALSRLPSEMDIYPGHGKSSTLMYELKNNPGLMEAINES